MSRPKVYVWIGGVIIAAVLCYFFPLFRITAIDGVDETSGGKPQTGLSVADFVEDFWKIRLPHALVNAVEIGTLLDAVDRDGASARSQFGREVGLGGACFFFVRGAGHIEEVTPDRLVVRIDGRDQRACIETGVIIGNAIRDSTGLVDVNQFPNSQDFNNLSDELNRRAETEVIGPSLDRLRAGVALQFVGCAQVSGDKDFDPLCLVPVQLNVESEDSPL